MNVSKDTEIFEDREVSGSGIVPEEKPALIDISDGIIETPWDARVFGLNTYEIQVVSKDTLKQAAATSGHFTVRVDPLSSKELLHEYGFYYCDTLIQPYCSVECFICFEHEAVGISRSIPIDKLVAISHGAFVHGRFHRDFNIDKQQADMRYDMWLKDLYDAGNVYALTYDGELAGFFGFNDNRIVLHALSEKYAGQGLAKYFWSAACNELFNAGHDELTSSISASNAPVLNLYASLGFKFRNPVDVYHRFNP